MDILRGRSFQVPDEVYNFPTVLSSGLKAARVLEVLFQAVTVAWSHAIQPRMRDVRARTINTDSFKEGTDFFTEADVESERVIVQTVVDALGPTAFRIFAEEAGAYAGNLDSPYTLRVDPIDSTESFKFGKPSWSIMTGIYHGRGKEEKQVLSAVYYPEYFNEMLYRVDGLGVYISNLSIHETEKIEPIATQDDIGDMLIAVGRGQDDDTRKQANKITVALEKAGGRVKSSSSIEAKEALQTGGKRTIITNTSFDSVDYIAFSALVSLGYKAFDFSGNEWNIDDENIRGRGIVLVPPGRAGKKILDTIMAIV